MELVSDDGARFALTVLGPGSVVVDVLLAAQARPPGSPRDGYPDRPPCSPRRRTGSTERRSGTRDAYLSGA